MGPFAWENDHDIQESLLTFSPILQTPARAGVGVSTWGSFRGQGDAIILVHGRGSLLGISCFSRQKEQQFSIGEVKSALHPCTEVEGKGMTDISFWGYRRGARSLKILVVLE